jgi:hypothetical protein
MLLLFYLAIYVTGQTTHVHSTMKNAKSSLLDYQLYINLTGHTSYFLPKLGSQIYQTFPYPATNHIAKTETIGAVELQFTQETIS